MTNFLAAEQGLVAFDSVDNFQDADVLQRQGKPIPAPHAFARLDDASLFKFRENLGEKTRRYYLEFCHVAAAQCCLARVGKPKQAVNTVFDTDS